MSTNPGITDPLGKESPVDLHHRLVMHTHDDFCLSAEQALQQLVEFPQIF